MKRLQQFALLACILGSAYIAGGLLASAVTPIEAKRPTKKLNPIVRLVDEKGNTFCTGTVLTPNKLLTAAHCVLIDSMFGVAGVRRDIGIRPPSNKNVSVTANVSAVRYQMDQAVLTGDFSKFENAPFIADPTKLNHPDLKNNANKTACGYPLGGPLYCNTLYFQSPIGFMWKVKGVLIPGMSGGPVLLDDGSVVATNVAVENDNAVVSPIYYVDREFNKVLE